MKAQRVSKCSDNSNKTMICPGDSKTGVHLTFLKQLKYANAFGKCHSQCYIKKSLIDMKTKINKFTSK